MRCPGHTLTRRLGHTAGAASRSGTLYLVAFEMREVWGERYNGPASDSLLVDIFEQWLEPVDATA